MPIASVADLLTLVQQHGLLEPKQFNEITPALLASFPEAKTLAKEMMIRGWLTPYQVNQLFQDRGGELVLGPYILLERIGAGGMGTVFKARHRFMRRVVAIKVIRKDRLASENAVKQFYREVHAAAQLSHPNVVHAFDADQIAGTHILVMEYIDGINLAQLVQEQGPLPVLQACDHIRQAALGLQHAHERGLVHRDIKPSNLLLTSGGRRSPEATTASSAGTIKILDLGLARFGQDNDDSSGLAEEGATLGRLDFLAPEQGAGGGTIDIRADLYSLGCTFYFLLTGQVLFPNCLNEQKIAKHQNEDPVPVQQARSEVPDEVAAILAKLLAKKPEDRFQTPAELAGALADILQVSEAAAAPAPDDESDALANTAISTAMPATEPMSQRSPFAGLWDEAADRDQTEIQKTASASGRGSLLRDEQDSLHLGLLVGSGAILLLLGVAVWVGLRAGRATPTVAATLPDPVNQEIQIALADLEIPGRRGVAADKLMLHPDRLEFLEGILAGLGEEDSVSRKARNLLTANSTRLMPQLVEAARRGRFSPERLALIHELVNPPLRWHLAGPFPITPKKDRIPVEEFSKQPDFTQTYPGVENRPVGWKEAAADGNGRINLRDFWKSGERWSSYGFTRFEVAADSTGLIHFDADDRMVLWLNGVKLRNSEEDGEEGRSPRKVKFRKGTNSLMVRVDNSGGGDWWQTVRVDRPLPPDLQSPPVLALFEDDPWLVEQLKEGEGRVELITTDRYSGLAALKVTPHQRFFPRIPRWHFPIVDNPVPGSYRYLSFAWKRIDGEFCLIQLSDNDNWNHRYQSGKDTGMNPVVTLPGGVPKDWRLQTVDLFKDHGGFTLTGLAVTPREGGAMLLDHIYLARSLADLKQLQEKQKGGR
jgi:serine/threonine-protein kinase